MKEIKASIAILLLLVSLSSCSDSNDNPSDTIEGNWRLVHVTGGILGVDQTFEGDKIIWKFNSQNQNLIVVDNNTDQNLIDGLDSGSYEYSIISNPGNELCNQSIIIEDNGNMGCISIDNTKLTINDLSADGFKYEFRRQEYNLLDI